MVQTLSQTFRLPLSGYLAKSMRINKISIITRKSVVLRWILTVKLARTRYKCWLWAYAVFLDYAIMLIGQIFDQHSTFRSIVTSSYYTLNSWFADEKLFQCTKFWNVRTSLWSRFTWAAWKHRIICRVNRNISCPKCSWAHRDYRNSIIMRFRNLNFIRI